MEDNFQIYFVKPDKNEENSSSLVEAFETLYKSEFNFKPEWITQDDCLKVSNKGKHIYIFDPFEGKGFDHIYSLGYRIYGPRCLLANLLHGMELPRNRKQPIYNLAMKGVKLCCTSVDKKTRDEIMKLTQLMGGEVSCDLTADITHLVAGEVGSNKYLVASENGKQIMVKEWVFKVWEVSQTRHIFATDDMFTKYSCPAFLGLTIVVSGFTVGEKNKMRNLITSYGGKYSGELQMNECTHLIVKEPKGPKFEAAKNWQIRIVNEQWLLHCLEKQKYLDPKAYQFNVTAASKKVNTSTPERISVLGPNINDISAISVTGPNSSMLRVDETNMTSSRLSCMFTTTGKATNIAETRLGVTGFGDNTTLPTADVFLDGCKIYLSGMKSSVEDKAKKIISAGGGLRALNISEGISHVIVGDIVSSEIKQILKLQESPFVVTIDWLMDCFAQNSHVSEDKYICSDFDPQAEKEKSNKINNPLNGRPSKELKSVEEKRMSKEAKANTHSQDRSSFKHDAPSDLEMAELLSQYLEPAAPTNSKPEDSTEKLGDGNGGQSTIILAEKIDEDTLTQDPNDLISDGDKGIFHNLKFIILGFVEEIITKLTSIIIENDGQVIDGNKRRQVVDIAIVPLGGHPVDVTVSEILTDFWLEYCLENGTFIPYDSHWLNRPMELPESEPLKGLCITVSGYTGVERNWIIDIASFLGANCQNKLSRKATKTVMVNTHLIVNQPIGSKYLAAKKWNLPAVGKEWLIKCIETGTKAPEEEFAVEILYQQQLESGAINSSSTSETDPRERQTSSTSTLPTPVAVKRKEEELKAGNEEAELKAVNKDKSALNSSVHDLVQTKDRVPSSSGESSESGHPKDTNPIISALTKENESSNQQSDKQRKIVCHPSQTDNITAGCLKTPASVMRQKWGINVLNDSPATTPYGMIKGGGETPGTFMKPGFKPKFNIDGVFSSPETTEDLNKSTPWGETFKRHISRAAQMATAQNGSAADADQAELPPSQHDVQPLHGVIIAVAKKLGRSHEQYNNIVVELGGNYSWQMGQNVTHFVFQGRPNDTNKEFRNAREQGKIIVSPYWLFACKEQNARVDESLYPHNFNPSYSLAMTPAAKLTPLRSSRNATKSSHTSEAMPTSTPVRASNKKLPILNLQKVSCTEHNENVAGENALFQQPKENQELVSEKSLEPIISIEGNSADDSEEKVDSSLTDGENAEDKNKHQEIKDTLAKTMGLKLANALSSSRSRKKGNLVNFSGNTSEGSSSGSPLMKSGTSLSHLKAPSKEPSQSLEVIWDDSTARLEQQKSAEKLQQVCQPSQNTDDYLLAAVEITQLGKKIYKTEESHQNKFANTKSPTPEPPPLAFPIPKPTSHVQAPQPIELISPDPGESKTSVKSAPVFIMSGLQNEERLDYSALVERLGGKTLEFPHFHSSCTHLVVSQPTRNEKCLSSIASGKWVLHKSYFEACRQEGKFVEESPHEWGSEYTLALMKSMDKQSAKLAAAAHKWRKNIADSKKKNPSYTGAFDGWEVFLCLDRKKEDNFKRMLEAGGATVTSLRSPFPEDVKGTHAFLDLNKVKIAEQDIEKLLLAEIHCLKAEYIPAYLVENPSPSDFYPEQINVLKACLSGNSRKRRRGSNDSGTSSKIARH
ncbi:DNA topoisomerase 2-binding protein 1-B [Biomphalaria glabrata]|nr:DNA topoisomerase 2-binding protein 1-B [Biomphalaria glabrata]